MKLSSINLSGFKSIDAIEGASLDFGDITVLLGANGVGKSNLISFFAMLDAIIRNDLQNHVAQNGFADRFLHYGSKVTEEIEVVIRFTENQRNLFYGFGLIPHVNNGFLLSEIEAIRTGFDLGLSSISQKAQESNLPLTEKSEKLFNLLQSLKIFHFHDTSPNSRLRGQGFIEDAQLLRGDGGNLAAFLYRLKQNPETNPYYLKIVRYIQKVMPQFLDFDLLPNTQNEKYISLNWYAKQQSDYLMGAHQISDGTLRFMALATLLLQPPDLLPKVIILDEPELGLHPAALGYLAGMIKAASQSSQVILATQSQRLVDEFALTDIVVVEQNPQTGSTIFSRKDPEILADWLADYSLSELWEKNVIGGQP